jgi:dTDP-4-dehydrorhamnose reductase
MEILVIGAGQVGSAVGELAPQRAVVTTSRDADIRRREQVDALIAKHGPSWVILSAAISDVGPCERDPQFAHEVNVNGARNVAAAARAADARLVFLSTDYVFDGRASVPYEVDMPRHAINVYGETKIAAEDEVRAILPDAVIARTSWVFGVHRSCFATKALQQGKEKHELKVVIDKYNCPTYGRDLAQMLIGLIDGGASGVFHCVNRDAANWLEFAQALLDHAGIRDVRFIETTLAKEYDVPRPANTPLSVTSLDRIGIPARPWREAVPDFIAEMRQRGML